MSDQSTFRRSVISIIRDALALVDAWTRRRVAASAAFSAGLAMLEIGAFALLYVLLDVIANDTANLADRYVFLQRLLGTSDRSNLISFLAVATIALLLLKTLSALVIARWQSGVQAHTESRLAVRLYREYIAQPYLFHVERNSAVLVRNLTASIGTLSSGVIYGCITSLTEGAVLIGVFATLVVVDPIASAGIACFVALVVAVYLLAMSPLIHRTSMRELDLWNDMLRTMQEGFAGIKAVQVFDVGSAVADAYGRVRHDYAGVRSMATFLQRLPQYYLEGCMVLGISGAAVLLTQLRSPKEAYPLIGLMVVAALRLLPSVNRFLGAVNAIRIGGAAVDLLVRERLHTDTAPPKPTDTARMPSFSRALELRDVTFHYTGRVDPVLAHVDLRIGAGESVGIVGPSGCGKTTLVDLLLGLLEPSTGEILVDGEPLVPANLGSWRRQIGYVPQDTFLMDASIRENVLFFRALPDTRGDTDAVWEALDAAQLAEFVRTLPDGIDTSVGERGVQMSGGQRQRLGIARAMLQRPRVLVLDEATSALDAATENAIVDTVAGLQGEVTMVIIAHRLSTVRRCERIVMMDRGAIADQGAFDVLAARNPTFSEMVARSSLVTDSDF
jgi:ABC-type multidrug transport system fused ATPase/permease subunit